MNEQLWREQILLSRVVRTNNGQPMLCCDSQWHHRPVFGHGPALLATISVPGIKWRDRLHIRALPTILKRHIDY